MTILYLGPANLASASLIFYEGLHRFELVYYSDVSVRERRFVFSSPRMR